MAVYEEKWYTNSTSVGPYTFTFPYIKEADVKVEKNGTLLTLTTEYTQAFTSITLVSAPLSTDIIRIYRDTDSDTLSSTFYPGSAIRSSDLNDNFTQNLYASQESAENAKDALRATDAFIATTSDEGATWVTAGNNTNASTDPKGVGYAVTTSEAADTKSDTAVATANTADTNASAAVSTANTASTNASAAVTTANTANTTSNTASTNASAAVTTANAADTKADTAITSAATANTTAGNAVTTADSAVVTANSAVTTANSAVTSATTANTTAGSAVTTANAAVTTAGAAEDAIEKYVADANGLKGAGTTHGQTPDTDPRGVAYAVATAESAANSVAQSAIYTVVANFAALPALTDASLSAEGASPYYQVTDSTLIQDELTVTGEPANFIGDDELAVKLKANITASPKVWEWQEYYATDPETRYRKKLIVESLATISEDYTIGIGNNGLSVGTVTISSANTVTIPANSRYVVL
tara:strand:+ start:560 stop:1975 length:1416 start_codon:yes stop_codon:yes gene_type:complete